MKRLLRRDSDISVFALVEIRVLPGFPVEAFGNDGLNKSQELNQKRL